VYIININNLTVLDALGTNVAKGKTREVKASQF
jgi:hypothetical protein